MPFTGIALIKGWGAFCVGGSELRRKSWSDSSARVGRPLGNAVSVSSSSSSESMAYGSLIRRCLRIGPPPGGWRVECWSLVCWPENAGWVVRVVDVEVVVLV